MGRPTTKAALLDAATTEFDRLWSAVDAVPPSDRSLPGACEDWSVKDLLAHLHAWHELTLGWEQAGRRGEMPAIPASGYTFAQTPALNRAIWECAADDDWDDIEDRLRQSHQTVMAVIDSYGDADLFTKKRYPWTRSTSIGSYLVSATSSHYAWASKLIRRWAKERTATAG